MVKGKGTWEWSSYDFYLPRMKREPVLSEKEIIDYNEQSLAGNLACMIDMPNLRTKYGPNNFILDRKTGYMYTRKGDDIIQIEERAHIFPVESMTLAGGPTNEGQSPTRTMHLTNIKNTPDAESTRVPIETSTDKRGESKVPMSVSSPFEELTMPKYEECALDTQYDKEQLRYTREEIENAEEERKSKNCKNKDERKN